MQSMADDTRVGIEIVEVLVQFRIPFWIPDAPESSVSDFVAGEAEGVGGCVLDYLSGPVDTAAETL